MLVREVQVKLSVLPYQAEEGRECLLLCQISGGTENDDDGVLLKLNGAITGIDRSAC